MNSASKPAFDRSVAAASGLPLPESDLIAIPEDVAFKFAFASPLFITTGVFDTWSKRLGDVLYAARDVCFPKEMPSRVYLFEGKSMRILHVDGATIIMLFEEYDCQGLVPSRAS